MKYEFDFTKVTIFFSLKMMYLIQSNDNINLINLIASVAKFDMLNLPANELADCIDSWTKQYEEFMKKGSFELDDVWNDWDDK